MLAGLLLVEATPLGAQLIRGRLNSNSSGPIVGAVVTLLDSTDAQVSRSVSNETGTFTLTASAPGTFRIRTLRIGFRPFTTDPFVVARDTTLSISIVGEPVVLAPVQTNAASLCKDRPDTNLVTFEVWQEAKTALLAAAITAGDPEYRFRASYHSRRMYYDLGLLDDISLTDSTFNAQSSWRSFPPEQLERTGYVTRGDSGLTFVPPDIDVLLSPYFAGSHCLKARNGRRNNTSLIALDFAPAASLNRVEIAGTLWLDARTRELQSLDFRFINFAFRGNDTLPGGRLEFMRLPTGAVVTTSWVVRMPIPPNSPTERRRAGLDSKRRVPGLGDWTNRSSPGVSHGEDAPWSDVPITANRGRWSSDVVRIAGGELREVRRDSVLIWSRPAGSAAVSVVVRDNATSLVAPNAEVFLVGSDRSATTDSRGRATFDDLLPGKYLVVATTPDLRLLRPPISATMLTVASHDGAIIGEAQVKLDSPSEARHAVCGKDYNDEGVILGEVVREGIAVPHAKVMIQFDATDSTGTTTNYATIETGENGRFRICNVPITGRTVLRSSVDGRTASASVVFPKGRFVLPITLSLSRPSPLRREPEANRPDRGDRGAGNERRATAGGTLVAVVLRQTERQRSMPRVILSAEGAKGSPSSQGSCPKFPVAAKNGLFAAAPIVPKCSFSFPTRAATIYSAYG
jgi:hypothetical protein